MDDDIFELTINDVKILLNVINGDSHLVNMNEFNVLASDLQEFFDYYDDCEDVE